MQDATCPICGSGAFESDRGRPRCTGCDSLPRGRAAWLLLGSAVDLSAGPRIAHFAPEPGIAKRLGALCGRGYEAYDLTPARYESADLPPVRRLDLCREIASLETGAYDAVIHNHVLEHVPCNATIVLQQLHALLRPGGAHVFSVPLTSGHSRSDLDPRLPRDERTARFHQRDHLRKFGRRDFDATLGMVFGLTARGYSIADHVPPETLHAAAVPEAQWTARSSTVFLVRRGKGRRGRMVPGRP